MVTGEPQVCESGLAGAPEASLQSAHSLLMRLEMLMGDQYLSPGCCLHLTLPRVIW